MILKSVRLENIRSYTNQFVKFPQGSVLLSGDIGSGKSSILLAIEFALFGISKGGLSGSTLLRKGAEQGSVELAFNLNGREYLIKRNLKKSRDIIAQSAGYILQGDNKKEGTAQELKAQILNLLGYPQEMLTKKSMIYRYTIYTPQEEMKQILQDDKESRLNTLRKVFDIDKYKKISENSVIITRKIKEEKKLLQGKISDIGEKNQLLEKEESNKKETDKKLFALLPLVKAAQEKVSAKQSELDKQQVKIKELNEHKRKLESVKTRIQEKVLQNNKNNQEIEEVRKEIEEMKEKIAKTSDDSGVEDKISKDIAEKKQKIAEIEGELKEIPQLTETIEVKSKEVVELTKVFQEKSTIRQQYEQNKLRIIQMSECPTCKQEVSSAHKQNIASIEDVKIRKADEELEKAQEEKKKAQQELDNGKIKLEMLRIKEKEFNKLSGEAKDLELSLQKKTQERDKLKSVNEEKNKLLESKIRLKQEIKDEVGTINQLKTTLKEKIEGFGAVEEEYNRIKEDYRLLLNKEKELAVKEAQLRTELQSKDKRMLELKEEIERKMKAKEKLGKLNLLQQWLEEYFIKLMSTMERHVMAKVHVQFNELFQQWFNVLLEDETITARLDEEFTPVIVQNGYETDVSNLSGGEKTSLALAYRLSLNKVINNIISSIKTKDLIILDEPTDGFSTEQLDKVREVLDQLDTKQTIIVSHESKIESYVDNIIRISKGEHVSKVIG